MNIIYINKYYITKNYQEIYDEYIKNIALFFYLKFYKFYNYLNYEEYCWCDNDKYRILISYYCVNNTLYVSILNKNSHQRILDIDINKKNTCIFLYKKFSSNLNILNFLNIFFKEETITKIYYDLNKQLYKEML